MFVLKEIFLNNGSRLFIFLPAIDFSPDERLSKPAINLNFVDFSHPDGPNKTTNSPTFTLIFKFSIA